MRSRAFVVAMERFATGAALTALVLALAMSVGRSVSAAPARESSTVNLVPNSSLEISAEAITKAADWIEGSQHQRSGEEVHSGAWALKSGFTGNGTSSHLAPIPVTPGTTYTISVWIFKAGDTGAGCLDMNDIPGELQMCATRANEWQLLSGDWMSGANRSVVVRLVTDGHPDGPIYFDDVTMRAAAAAPAPAISVAADTAARPVVIDTDMAGDDWMAILYLLQRTDLEVRVLTVTGTGEAHCGPGVQNAMKVLALAGKPDIEVACGRGTPLEGKNTFPPAWREAMDAMLGLALPANPRKPSKQNAVGLLRKIIGSSSQRMVLVTFGPLTNIAELLRVDPLAADYFEMIYVMGGALNVPGNLRGGLKTNNVSAEWNIFVDPTAAEEVVRSGVPITLVGLDATQHAPLTKSFYDKLAADQATPKAMFVRQQLDKQMALVLSGNWYFWDQLTAVAATDASVITTELHKIRVITDAGPELGRVVEDSAGALVRVAVGADARRFEQIFLDVLNGRQP